MTSLLARMERDGLILRKDDPEDARARLVSLTPRARTALARVKQAMGKVVEEALAGVGKTEQAALIKTLQTIVTNLSDELRGSAVR
jgi:DNA-binding MarR family transcriptional regulator